ncbi:hypothetical protein [Wolbachia pipientis]|nr:hypothetical protein [Wolbachia pipientis]
MDHELLKEFDINHPFRELKIVVYSTEGNEKLINYIFNICD